MTEIVEIDLDRVVWLGRDGPPRFDQVLEQVVGAWDGKIAYGECVDALAELEVEGHGIVPARLRILYARNLLIITWQYFLDDCFGYLDLAKMGDQVRGCDISHLGCADMACPFCGIGAAMDAPQRRSP